MLPDRKSKACSRLQPTITKFRRLPNFWEVSSPLLSCVPRYFPPPKPGKRMRDKIHDLTVRDHKSSCRKVWHESDLVGSLSGLFQTSVPLIQSDSGPGYKSGFTSLFPSLRSLFRSRQTGKPNRPRFSESVPWVRESRCLETRVARETGESRRNLFGIGH